MEAANYQTVTQRPSCKLCPHSAPMSWGGGGFYCYKMSADVRPFGVCDIGIAILTKPSTKGDTGP